MNDFSMELRIKQCIDKVSVTKKTKIDFDCTLIAWVISKFKPIHCIIMNSLLEKREGKIKI